VAAELRRHGKTWVQIAEDFQRRYGVNPRLAIRWAHGWSQRQEAALWNARGPAEPKTLKNEPYWEDWRRSPGRQPAVAGLERWDVLYEVSVTDLLADLADYRHLDASAPAHTNGTSTAAIPAPPGTAELSSPERSAEEQRDDMERRRLLQLAAASLGA